MAKAFSTLDLVWLRTFVAVADQRSMTAAANALHLTQGAVSQQVKKLEQWAGGPLLIRERRGIELAPLGERLMARARRMLALNDQLWADLQGDAVQGSVRLGAPYDLAGAWIAPAIKSFIEAYPQVELSLKCGSSTELKTALDNGALDLAIVEGSADTATGECLAIERLVWAGAKGGAAFLKTPLPVSMVAETCAFRAPVIAALQAQGRPWRTLFENGNLEATVAMVSSDLAVSVWLQSTVPPSLEVLPAEAPLPSLAPVAVSLHRSKGAGSAAADELARHIRGHLGRV